MKHWFFLIVTTLLWGIIPVLDKRGLAGEQVSPEAGLVVRLFAAGALVLLILPFAAPLQTGIKSLSWRAAFLFAASGIVSMILSQYCYYQVLARQDAAKVFPILFAGAPVVGMALAWLLLGETITVKMLLGGALIVVGSMLMLM